MKIFLGAILLLLVGCSGVVEAERDPVQAQSTQVEELVQRIEHLEDRLEGLELLIPIPSDGVICETGRPKLVEGRWHIRHGRSELV
jgi:hypothetical protein